jgi:hypothetical protein
MDAQNRSIDLKWVCTRCENEACKPPEQREACRRVASIKQSAKHARYIPVEQFSCLLCNQAVGSLLRDELNGKPVLFHPFCVLTLCAPNVWLTNPLG